MKIFNYHPISGFLIGESVADESPLEEGVFLVPAFATDLVPPARIDGKNIVFTSVGWTYEDIPLPIPDPEPLPPTPVTRIDALQGLLAIDASGLADEYEVWANDPARTFAERAFINKAQIWRRDDATLAGAATALGLTDAQVDAMFELAATL